MMSDRKRSSRVKILQLSYHVLVIFASNLTLTQSFQLLPEMVPKLLRSEMYYRVNNTELSVRIRSIYACARTAN